MPAQTDHAVVLRLTEYSETSQIITLFSAAAGLLRLIAKGARRGTKKRFATGLDLLELGDVGYLPPRGDAQLGILTEWVQRDTFPGLRRELLRLYGALYAAELVAGLTEEHDPHPGLFHTLVQALRALAGAGPAARELPRFQHALLGEIGYVPDLARCVVCGRPSTSSGVWYFSAGAGGLICRDCEAPRVEKRRVSRRLLGTAPENGDPGEWFEILDYHLTHLAGRPFKTAAQLRPLLRQEARRGDYD